MNNQEEIDLFRDTYVRYLGNNMQIITCYSNFHLYFRSFMFYNCMQ